MSIDNNLWRALSEDNSVAFDQLIDRYYSTLVSFSFSITQNYAESEDIVQELFVKLWTDRHQPREYLSLRNYLYTSTRNRSLNHIRSSYRMESFQQQLNLHEDSFIKMYLSEETYRVLHAAIESLPERNQLVVRHTLRGLQLQDMADQMGLSLRTINSIKADSLELLRIYLEKEAVLD